MEAKLTSNIEEAGRPSSLLASNDDITTESDSTAGRCVRDAARQYLESGWYPVPIAPGKKTPTLPGWPALRVRDDEVDQYFSADSNVGLLLGEASNGLVDIDFDHPAAKMLAHTLPKTNMVHGRGGNPESHRWYDIVDTIPATTRFVDPETKEVLVELRSTGGQTVVPPSRYIGDSGYDQLVWAQAGAPGKVEGADLLARVSRLAATALLGKHWPGEGSRNDAALALAGTLLLGGMLESDVEQVICNVAYVAGDEEVEARVKTVASTRARMNKGGAATGRTRLSEFMPATVVAKACQWLALTPPTPETHSLVWETPALFDDVALPDIPGALLPGAYGEFASALATATEVPEALPTLAVLATISTAVAQRFMVSPKPGWNEPINIYVMVALPPANNKSLVLREATMPLTSWEITQAGLMEPLIATAKSQLKSHEKLVESERAKAVKETDPDKRFKAVMAVGVLESQAPTVPVLPQLFANDATPESLAQHVAEQHGRFAIIGDEGGIVETLGGLYTSGVANIDIVLKGIDGGHVRIRRRDRQIDINPFLTFLLTVQPQIIRNMGGKRAFKGNGLLERFLYAVPASQLGYRTHASPPVPAELRTEYHRAVSELLKRFAVPASTCGAPQTLTLSAAASDQWRAWQHEIESRLRPDGEYRAMLGWAGKLAGYTLRIAGLMHVAQHSGSASEIDSATMERAINMARSLAQHAKQAFVDMGTDQATEDAKVMAPWIHANAPSFSRSTALGAFHGRFNERKRLTEALQVLCDRHYISEPTTQRTGRAGRPPEMYMVNPMLLAARGGN